MAALKSDMITMREFSRRLAHFKRLAAAGKTVRLVDRQGKQFTFQCEKPTRCFGAARSLAAGPPLGPDPVPRAEWKGNY